LREFRQNFGIDHAPGAIMLTMGAAIFCLEIFSLPSLTLLAYLLLPEFEDLDQLEHDLGRER
jgi:hypothetical protein